MKLRRLYRWILAVVGCLSVAFLGVGYYIHRILALKYFPDTDWIASGVSDSLFFVAASYLVLVAVLGKWKLWFGR